MSISEPTDLIRFNGHLETVLSSTSVEVARKSSGGGQSWHFQDSGSNSISVESQVAATLRWGEFGSLGL